MADHKNNPTNTKIDPKALAPQQQDGAAPPADAQPAGPSPELRAALTASSGAPSADELWQIHRAALGGVSSATGAQPPERLSDAPDGARFAHYAMARYVAQRFGAAPADRHDHLDDTAIDRATRLLASPSQG